MYSETIKNNTISPIPLNQTKNMIRTTLKVNN